MKRREAFLFMKRRMKEMRVIFYRFGQLSSLSYEHGEPPIVKVMFEKLNKNIKLEEIPNEYVGIKIQVNIL